MNHDQAFRTALIVIFVLFVPIGLYHRIQSQATGEKLDRRQEGIFILATLRPAGAVLWIGLLAYIIDPSWMAWSSVRLPDWLRWTGVGVCALACALLIWTFRRLGKNLTDTVVTRREHTLITHGPYRWVRHPFYDSGALLSFGASVVAANWFLFATSSVFVCLIVIRTRVEERNLLARFGDSYQAYIDRTGRFLPRFTRPSTAPVR
jgi:protein-S-isoprenylcysteine O-methyltransferase Ste14